MMLTCFLYWFMCCESYDINYVFLVCMVLYLQFSLPMSLCVCVRVVTFIIYFNLTQTALFMERGGSTHWAGGHILVCCDVEVCENTHHHCCTHLYLGSGIQHSGACKTSIFNLTSSFIFISHFIVLKHIGSSCILVG
jgi:hypothetical protein